MITKEFHNNPKGREKTEWSNFWYSNANSTEEGNKLLIIGDSTGRKIRSTLENLAATPVDFLGTSSGLHDLLFYSQVEAFFSVVSHKYESIFVWLGYHSLINENGDSYRDEDYLMFEKDIRDLIGYLQEYGKNIVLCSAFYPVKKNGIMTKKDWIWFHLKPFNRMSKEIIDWNEASIIRKKNIVLEKVANDNNIVFCDINHHMLQLSEKFKTRCIHYDKIHYEGKAYPIIAKFLLDSAR